MTICTLEMGAGQGASQFGLRFLNIEDSPEQQETTVETHISHNVFPMGAPNGQFVRIAVFGCGSPPRPLSTANIL